MPRLERQIPIRVLFLDHTAKASGGEIALFHLVRNLDRHLFEPIVILCAEGPLVHRMQPYAETHVLPLSDVVGGVVKDGIGWRSLFRYRTTLLACAHIVKVAKMARRLRVDLVHTNSLKADIIGGLAGRLARIPVIWHVRDRIEPDYLPAAVVRAFRWLSRTLPHYVIANSQATLNSLCFPKAPGAGIAKRSRVVHDGCDVAVTREVKLGIKRGPRIGLIGRISPWKGQDIFLQAVALVRHHYPTAHFEIIGAPLFSELEYEAHLHHLCHALQLDGAVEFTGFVEDVPARIAELDIVVHASTMGEPFGQVIIEAMAEQKPVVATNGGGVPEIVQDGITGLLVPMGDAPSMAQAIIYLLDHPEAAARMGREGQKRVLAHFTLNKTARLVESVFRQVLRSADDQTNPEGHDWGIEYQSALERSL